MDDWIQETLQAKGVLKNKWNIADQKTPDKVEQMIYWIKEQDIVNDDIQIDSIQELKLFHKMLFSELYDWAGMYRKGNFGKNQKTFFPRERFDRAEIELNRQINHILASSYQSKIVLANDLARLLLDINEFHPFREGNGRTQRIFIRMLTKQKGYQLHLAKNSAMYEKYMAACVNDDLSQMSDLLVESI